MGCSSSLPCDSGSACPKGKVRPCAVRQHTKRPYQHQHSRHQFKGTCHLDSLPASVLVDICPLCLEGQDSRVDEAGSGHPCPCCLTALPFGRTLGLSDS